MATSQSAAVQPSPRAAEITAEPPERATLTEVTAPCALGRPNASASPLRAPRRFSLPETPSLAACEAGSYQQVTCVRGGGQVGREGGAGLGVLLVGGAVGAPLHVLGGHVDRQLGVAGDLDQRLEERAGRVGGILELGRAAPPLGGALLEDADRVQVAVGQVLQLGFLPRGGVGDGQRLAGEPVAGGDAGDGRPRRRSGRSPGRSRSRRCRPGSRGRSAAAGRTAGTRCRRRRRRRRAAPGSR